MEIIYRAIEEVFDEKMRDKAKRLIYTAISNPSSLDNVIDEIVRGSDDEDERK